MHSWGPRLESYPDGLATQRLPRSSRKFACKAQPYASSAECYTLGSLFARTGHTIGTRSRESAPAIITRALVHRVCFMT